MDLLRHGTIAFRAFRDRAIGSFHGSGLALRTLAALAATAASATAAAAACALPAFALTLGPVERLRLSGFFAISDIVLGGFEFFLLGLFLIFGLRLIGRHKARLDAHGVRPGAIAGIAALGALDLERAGGQA